MATKKPVLERAGEEARKNMTQAARIYALPATLGAKAAMSVGRGAGQFASGLTGIGATPEAQAAPVAANQPAAVLPAVRVAPPNPQRQYPTDMAADVALNPAVPPAPTFINSLKRVATPATPATAAPAVAAAPAAVQQDIADQPTGQGPTTVRLGGDAAASAVPRTTAQDMTSGAALGLAQQMATGRFFDRASQTGNKRYRDFIGGKNITDEASKLRWQDAYNTAIETAMSPQQLAQKRRMENQRAVEQGANFEASPEGIQSRRASQEKVDVAKAGSEGKAAEIAVTLAQLAQQRELKGAELSQARDLAEKGLQLDQIKMLMDAKKSEDANKTQRDIAKGKVTTTEDMVWETIKAAVASGGATVDDIPKLAQTLREEAGIATAAQAAPQQTANPVADAVSKATGAGKALSPAETKSLPVGTIYLGTDGKKHRKV